MKTNSYPLCYQNKLYVLHNTRRGFSLRNARLMHAHAQLLLRCEKGLMQKTFSSLGWLALDFG